MSDFDIASLSNLAPPKYLCQKCLALDSIEITDAQQAVCQVCKVEYIATEGVNDHEVYLKAAGYSIEIDNVLDYTMQLASINSDFGKPRIVYPPLRILLRTLNSARVFVHFVSYGIDTMLLGALKTIAQKVDVRGIVSGESNSYVLGELEGLNFANRYIFEAPKLKIKQAKKSASAKFHLHAFRKVKCGLA
jgi:hypothetical protein